MILLGHLTLFRNDLSEKYLASRLWVMTHFKTELSKVESGLQQLSSWLNPD
jgi:hypothetical protein